MRTISGTDEASKIVDQMWDKAVQKVMTKFGHDSVDKFSQEPPVDFPELNADMIMAGEMDQMDQIPKTFVNMNP